MHNISLMITLSILVLASGCSNVRYVKARDNCHRNLFLFIPWDSCGEKGERLPQQKMIGEASPENDNQGDQPIAVE